MMERQHQKVKIEMRLNRNRLKNTQKNDVLIMNYLIINLQDKNTNHDELIRLKEDYFKTDSSNTRDELYKRINHIYDKSFYQASMKNPNLLISGYNLKLIETHSNNQKKMKRYKELIKIDKKHYNLSKFTF